MNTVLAMILLIGMLMYLRWRLQRWWQSEREHAFLAEQKTMKPYLLHRDTIRSARFNADYHQKRSLFERCNSAYESSTSYDESDESVRVLLSDKEVKWLCSQIKELRDYNCQLSKKDEYDRMLRELTSQVKEPRRDRVSK